MPGPKPVKQELALDFVLERGTATTSEIKRALGYADIQSAQSIVRALRKKRLLKVVGTHDVYSAFNASPSPQLPVVNAKRRRGVPVFGPTKEALEGLRACNSKATT